MIRLLPAINPKDYTIAAQLFEEYATQIGVDLSFQNFKEELAAIEQQYGKPNGVIYLAYDRQDHPAGCFGIRPFDGTICELKRMYLQPSLRGKGVGKQMLQKAIEVGKNLGYTKMRLDTLPTMESAIGLYKKLGFYEIPAYRYNPIAGTKYFELDLKNP
ncbi:MAG: GNAT family N-acetyltransferase [Bacteroidota bacterium]